MDAACASVGACTRYKIDLRHLWLRSARALAALGSAPSSASSSASSPGARCDDEMGGMGLTLRARARLGIEVRVGVEGHRWLRHLCGCATDFALRSIVGAAVNVKSTAAAGPRLDESTSAMGGDDRHMLPPPVHVGDVRQAALDREAALSLHLRSSPSSPCAHAGTSTSPSSRVWGSRDDSHWWRPFELGDQRHQRERSAPSPWNEALRPPVNDSKRPRHETSQSLRTSAPSCRERAWPRHETLQSQCVEASTDTLRSQEDGAFNSQEGVRSQSPGVETVAGAARGPSELDEEHSARPSVRPSELDEEHSVADPEALAQLGMRLHRLDAARRAELGRMCEPLPDTRWLRDDPLMTT